MKAQTWDEANRARNRAFHETYVGTIRLCPENYCLAFRSNETGLWVASRNDGAVGKDNYNKIQAILDNYDEAEWLERIGRIFPRVNGGYCFNYREK